MPPAVATMSSARTSASWLWPNQTTRAAVCAAIAATRESSRLSRAMDVAGRSRTISDFARWIASIPPNSPACASPTLSTTEMSGVAIATSRAISPSWLAPISTTRYSVCSSTRSIEIGAPTWLLNDPCGATVGPSASSTARSRFLVVVLPLEPVIATIRSFPRSGRARRPAAPWRPGPRRRRARSTAAPRTSTARSATTSAAPASTAAGANRCPSVSSPGRAKNTEPAPTRRESVSTVPETTVRVVLALGQEQGAAERLRELGEGECDHAQPASRSAARASSRAEYGVRTPSMSR